MVENSLGIRKMYYLNKTFFICLDWLFSKIYLCPIIFGNYIINRYYNKQITSSFSIFTIKAVLLWTSQSDRVKTYYALFKLPLQMKKLGLAVQEFLTPGRWRVNASWYMVYSKSKFQPVKYNGWFWLCQ